MKLLGRNVTFSKNADRCKRGNGLRTNTHQCIWYHKITKACVLVDYLPIKEGEADSQTSKESTSESASSSDMTQDSADPLVEDPAKEDTSTPTPDNQPDTTDET